MDINLSKNGFFSRSTQLYLMLGNISIKQLIVKGLQETIVIYQIENCISPNLNQVLSLLSDKVILQGRPNIDSFVYCSAIAFPLANLYHVRSRQVAEDLVSLLALNSLDIAAELKLNLTIRVVKNGLIEFAFCDRSIGWWLECLGKLGNWEIEELGNLEDYNCFPVQYVHNRCCSLLSLAAKEGLIKLEKNTWQITNQNLFAYYWDENIAYCYEPTEIHLLRQISLVIDYLSDRTDQDPKTWWQLNLKLSDACLKFIAACRIFGSVARNQQSLAIARLGLISIVQSCLLKVIS